MERKRIVVTGLGAITPLGNSAGEMWNALKKGQTGINSLQNISGEDLPTKYAAEVKNFDPLAYMEKKDSRKMDKYAQFCVASIKDAVKDAHLDFDTLDPYRIINVQGVGMGGMSSFEQSLELFITKGYKSVPIMSIPKIIANSGPANASMLQGNICGSTYTVTTACSSGTDAIGAAMRHLSLGEADIALAGGSESTITRYGIACFNVLHALSTKWVDTPQQASRPFDTQRDGFVMGEGSATLVLETLEHAQKRGAKIYCELVGYGGTCDAFHYTSPHPEGLGAFNAIKLALKSAGISSDQIDYINAHGTSTPINDPVEAKVIRSIFGEDIKAQPKVSSTKSMTGHCLGATGALEALACIFAINHSFIPPTINLDTIDEGCHLNHVANQGIDATVNYAMSNTFGFGGHNGVVIFKKFTP